MHAQLNACISLSPKTFRAHIPEDLDVYSGQLNACIQLPMQDIVLNANL